MKQGETGAKTYYVYDGDDPVLEVTPSGSVSAVNVFGADGLVARTSGSGTTTYAFDPRGNVSEYVGSSGVATDATYSGYGAATTAGASPSDPFAFGAQWGYYLDRETGAYLCGHRYYDAGTGRWLSRDPAGVDGGVNLYSYCWDDPVNDADPDGRRPLTSRDIARLHALYSHRGTVPMPWLNSAVSRIKSRISAIPVGSDDPIGMQALWWAIDRLGSTAYAPGAMGNVDNCNVFVYDAYLRGAGASHA